MQTFPIKNVDLKQITSRCNTEEFLTMIKLSVWVCQETVKRSYCWWERGVNKSTVWRTERGDVSVTIMRSDEDRYRVRYLEVIPYLTSEVTKRMTSEVK